MVEYRFSDGTVAAFTHGASERELQEEVRAHGEIVSVGTAKTQIEAIAEAGNPVVSVEMPADLWGFLEEKMREKAVHDEDNRWYEAHRAIDLTLIKALQTAAR